MALAGVDVEVDGAVEAGAEAGEAELPPELAGGAGVDLEGAAVDAGEEIEAELGLAAGGEDEEAPQRVRARRGDDGPRQGSREW